MNTRIDFETAKLLKEKGFDIPCGQFYAENILDDDEIIKNNLCQRRNFGIYAIEITNYNFSYEYAGKKVNEGRHSAPTIGEVIMWIYKEHQIWIGVNEFSQGGGCRVFEYIINGRENSHNRLVFDSPIEAYLMGIKYVLYKSI